MFLLRGQTTNSNFSYIQILEFLSGLSPKDSKSKAEELYKDSISVNPTGKVPKKVTFEPFVGVSPIKYFQLFELIGNRKDLKGKVVNWEDGLATKNPRFKRFVLSYLLIETFFSKDVLKPFLEECTAYYGGV